MHPREACQQRVEVAGEGVRVETELVMIGAEGRGDGARVLGLVVRGIALEADREGREARRGVAGGERGDEARVEPARQERADGHVRHQALLDGALERGFHVDEGRPRGLSRALAQERRGRVACNLHRAAAGQRELVAGRQLEDVLVGRVRRERVPEAQERAERFEPGTRADSRREEGLWLRREAEAGARAGPEQRLFAGEVARQKQHVAIVDGEREHAGQAWHHGGAVLPPAGEEHLGVAAALEGVPARCEVGAELAVVVDFTVEDDERGAGPAHRLTPGEGEIEHGKPREPEERVVLADARVVVGAAVAERRQDVRHA